MLKVSILTIGDELCIGQVVNNNAAFIAENCTKIGAHVFTHSIIGDVKEQMFNEFDRLFKLSDVIITTGGLGPTHDDITKPVLMEYFNDELVFDNDSFENVVRLFKNSGREILERNRLQAYIPSKSKALMNPLGTAPGLMFESEGKYIFALPGVPSEMKSIMNYHILPILKELIEKRKEELVLYRVLQTSGIFESVLADLIGPPEDFLEGGTLAFLPSYRGVRLRIGVSAGNYSSGLKMLDKIEAKIRDKAGKYIIGSDEMSLTATIGNILSHTGSTVSVAESCTAGLLGSSLTEQAGSSAYFKGGVIVYSNEAKIQILGVRESTIKNFGAVSKETAIEMAQNVRITFNTNYGISITGIAGPDGGTEDKPVGTVWIGIADENSVDAYKYVFSNDRTVNRERSVGTALALLLREIKKEKSDRNVK